ncbi:MAG: NADP-dependent malic enzyme [Clostridiaceae bacterium]
MDINKKSLELHERLKGKIEVISKVKLENKEDLSLAYTPGVAESCREIHKNKENAYKYTSKGNLVAVVSDGTAVLGLGDIGPEAAMPVMEGKAILFKEFGDVDAFPICLDTKDVDEIVNIVKALAPTFGGINLEDIAAPRCFEIEKRLVEELNIPVFHDDQHGTAVVVLAAVINSIKLVNKKMEDLKIVINGAGAAGNAIAYLLMDAGAKNVILCDRTGVIYKERPGLTSDKVELAEKTNPDNVKGSLGDALVNSDIFIGVSAPNVVTAEMVKSMNKDAIVFPMANPIPEIMPDIAKEAGARIVGTGRSDFNNQINNVLVFPGLFRGVLDARAKKITTKMKLAAAEAIASLIPEDMLTEEYVIPQALNKEVGNVVAEAVKKAAIE